MTEPTPNPTPAGIRLAPTWEGLLPVLLLIHREGDSEGRTMANAELIRMAKAADRAVELEAARNA
jgi:hypothetical protein